MGDDSRDGAGERDADPVVALLEARIERLERTLEANEGDHEAAVAAAQLRAARRALDDYRE